MRALSEPDLLRVWEHASLRPPHGRGLAVLAAAHACDGADPATLPLGRCSELLLALREATFGPELAAVLDCPACSEPLELALSTRELLSAAAPDAPQLGLLRIDELELAIRPPNANDLMAVAGQPNAAQLLAQRCVISLRDGERELPVDALPSSAVAEIARRIQAEDPLADTSVEVRCAACGESREVSLDIAAFVWIEIERAAGQLLVEIDELASRYGWSERAILALGPVRRRAYLELAP